MTFLRDGAILHPVTNGEPLCGHPTRTPAGNVTRDDLLCGSCLDTLADPAEEDATRTLETMLQTCLRSLPYRDYLETAHWQRTRRLAFERYGDRCVLCGHTGTDVHHRTYERLGCEQLDDLIVLCRTCHDLHHASAA